MPGSISFRYNTPVILRLADPDRECRNYDQDRGEGHYQTTDGRQFTLPRPAVVKLLELDPAPGEEIGICKDESAKGASWRIWLTPASEQARSEAEAAQGSSEGPSDTELLLQASITRENGKKRRNGVHPIRKDAAPAKSPVQPRLFDRGTGTDGPLPAIQPKAIPLPAVARKTPYGDMLRHIVRTVESVLKAEGLQLGDGPKQDLISTVYIDAAKRNGVEYDFTREAE